MIYPEDFKLIVEVNIPQHKRLHQAIAMGETNAVQRYLEDEVSVNAEFQFLLDQWLDLYSGWVKQKAGEAWARTTEKHV